MVKVTFMLLFLLLISSLMRCQSFQPWRRVGFWSKNVVSCVGASKDPSGGFSFTEDSVFESPEEEIEAMGGDPFFLEMEAEQEGTAKTGDAEGVDNDTPLGASKDPSGPRSARFSFAEGSDFESPEEEIEAMGGDPFFLEQEKEQEITVSTGDAEGVDKDTPFLWDGEVIEDAYFD
jgi:hypothetical protein